jgi:hypothetical protein
MSRAINFQTVSWFWDLYTRYLLELDPPYQRRSVWNQEKSNIQEAQNYYDAITTSPLYSGVEKTKAKIEILKSVIQGNINL